eukprot:3932043-Rhodomonas_salina.7
MQPVYQKVPTRASRDTYGRNAFSCLVLTHRARIPQTKAILDRDPFAHACLAFHLSSLVELKLARELFIAAHRL